VEKAKLSSGSEDEGWESDSHGEPRIELEWLSDAYHESGPNGELAKYPAFRRRLVKLMLRQMHCDQRSGAVRSEAESSDSSSEDEQELLRLFREWRDANAETVHKQTNRLIRLHKKRRSARKRLTDELAKARQTIKNFGEFYAPRATPPLCADTGAL
jgi:hypothetical protein